MDKRIEELTVQKFCERNVLIRHRNALLEHVQRAQAMCCDSTPETQFAFKMVLSEAHHALFTFDIYHPGITGGQAAGMCMDILPEDALSVFIANLDLQDPQDTQDPQYDTRNPGDCE